MADVIEALQPAANPPSCLEVLASGAMRFSLERVPQHEHLAVFREAFGREVIKYDLEPLPGAALDVDLEFRVLPDLAVMTGRMSGSHNRRTPRTLADDPTDDLGLIVNLRGPHRIASGRRELVLGDGEATLVGLGDACSFTHRPPGDILALRVPRRQLGPLVAAPDDRCLQVIPAVVPALAMLVRYVGLLSDGAVGGAPELAHVQASHVRDLMALAAGATREAEIAARSGGLRAARLLAIKQDIARNLHDPGLSVGGLAERHFCSPRSIQRLFEADGTTLGEHLLAKRLERARLLLLDPARRADKISNIALDAGFSDLSYFNRAFRRRFGDTPSGLRGG